MRYLTISADYLGSALRDDFAGRVEPEAAGLSPDLSEQLRSWNDRYRSVIPLGMDERDAPDVSEFIGKLDAEAVGLAERVAEELAPAKVRYFSEGELRYLG